MTLEFVKDASSNVYACERQEYRSSGTLQLPVYGNPAQDNPKYPNGAIDQFGGGATATPCRIVRLHAPIEWVVIVWTTVKEGAAPVVPNSYLFDPNLAFKFGRRSAAVPVDMNGYNGHAWAMSGEYHYHKIAPTDLNSSMQTGGILPYEQGIVVTDAIIPNVNFISTLLEKPPTSYQPPLLNTSTGNPFDTPITH